MSVIRIKMGICEYYLEYETLDEIKQHFIKNQAPFIGLDTFDNYGGSSRGERISRDDLSPKHIEWANEKCEWGARYLRGWKN